VLVALVFELASVLSCRERLCNDTGKGINTFTATLKINTWLLFMPQTKTITSIVSTGEAKLWVTLTGCADPH
jgi:hypothetical protein